MKVMVSACLLGENCKYDGGNNRNSDLLRKLQGCEVVPVCPETAGGLPVPRVPAEIVNGTVMNRDGVSVDAAFRAGAEKALELAEREKPDLIILQSRSPSCGVNQIYDGTFTGKRIRGRGVFAVLASRAGFRVLDVEDLDRFDPEREKKRKLFLDQKRTLDTFLERGAVSRQQYDRSLGDLVKKMGMEDEV